MTGGQLSIFAPVPSSAIDAAPEVPVCAQSHISHDDVLRLFVHKAGPFREVKDGAPTGREYAIAELVDGTFVYQFTDGERLPTPERLRYLIPDGIRFGTLVEVSQ